MVGQIIRSCIREWLERANIPFGVLGRFTLLMIIYTTFCDMFASDSASIKSTDFILIVIIVIICQVLFLSLAFFLSTRVFKQFQAPDVVAIIFCSTHKSLTLGIPMLKIIYSGYAHLSLISIPLLVYHPTQILLGGLLVPIVRSWMTSAMGRVGKTEMQEVTLSPRLSPFSV